MNLEWIKCLLKGHMPEFVRNVYGDEILLVGCRSLWRCKHCGSSIRSQELHLELHLESPPMCELTPEEVKHMNRLWHVPEPQPHEPPWKWDDQSDMDNRALLLAYMTRVIDECGISFLDANGHHSPLTDAQMDALMVIEAEASASLQA